MSPDNPNLESVITRRFEEMAGTSTFPLDVPPDDFQWRALLDFMGDVRGLRVLDAGCAKGRFVKALAASGARAVGVDPTWTFVRTAAGNAAGSRIAGGSVTRLPFREGAFDALICLEVIEHVPDLDEALAEMARVLRPGGRALIIDKNPVGIGYHRFYPNALYKRWLERSGRWFYPKEFPFRERWHRAGELARRARRHFSRVEVRYLDGRVLGRWRPLLRPIFAFLPPSRPDVAWRLVR